MTEDLLSDRRKALEQQFFRSEEAAALMRLRLEERRREERQALAEASGISNDAVLDTIEQLGIGPRTIAPLSLVPLVEIAWADGKMEVKEKQAVLLAAKDVGLDEGSVGYGLLQDWLTRRPDGQLKELWVKYTQSVCRGLTVDAREALRRELLGRARRVAEVTGGFLGLGPKVSRREEAVLAELATAFDG